MNYQDDKNEESEKYKKHQNNRLFSFRNSNLLRYNIKDHYEKVLPNISEDSFEFEEKEKLNSNIIEKLVAQAYHHILYRYNTPSIDYFDFEANNFDNTNIKGLYKIVQFEELDKKTHNVLKKQEKCLLFDLCIIMKTFKVYFFQLLEMEYFDIYENQYINKRKEKLKLLTISSFRTMLTKAVLCNRFALNHRVKLQLIS